MSRTVIRTLCEETNVFLNHGMNEKEAVSIKREGACRVYACL